MKRVNAAAKDNTDILKAIDHKSLTDFINKNSSALRGQQEALRQNNRDLKTWNAALRNIPKEVKTRLRQLNYEPTMKQVRNLKKQYDLTPKQVKTIIKEVGISPVKKQVGGLQKDLKGLGDVDPSNKWYKLFVGDLTKGKSESRKGADGMAKELKDGTAKAKPDLNPFKALFSTNISGLKSTASSGGSGIGSNLGSGINSGIGGWTSTISNTAASAVRQAISAARAEAQIKSPSRKMREIGSYMVEGLVVGFEQEFPKVRRAMTGLSREITNPRDKMHATISLDARGAYSASLAGSGAPAGGNTYQITVQAPVGASSVDIGRELTKHIGKYEQAMGRRRR